MESSDESDPIEDVQTLSDFGFTASSFLPTHLWHLVLAHLQPNSGISVLKTASEFLSFDSEDEREVCIVTGCNTPCAALHNYAVEKDLVINYPSIWEYSPEQSLRYVSGIISVLEMYYVIYNREPILKTTENQNDVLYFEATSANINRACLSYDAKIGTECIPEWMFRDFCLRLKFTLSGIIPEGATIKITAGSGECHYPPIMGDLVDKSFCGYEGRQFTLTRTIWLPDERPKEHINFKFDFEQWAVITKFSVEIIWPNAMEVGRKVENPERNKWEQIQCWPF